MGWPRTIAEAGGGAGRYAGMETERQALLLALFAVRGKRI